MGIPVVSAVMRTVFGTRNERMVKRYLRVVDEVNSYEEEIRRLSDQELRDRTEPMRKRLGEGANPTDILPEAFAVAREVMDRNVGMRNIFNPQHGFDPSVLPDDARRLYRQVADEIKRTEPAEPTGTFLGSREPVPA